MEDYIAGRQMTTVEKCWYIEHIFSMLTQGKSGGQLAFHVGCMCIPFFTVTFMRQGKRGSEFHVFTPLVQDTISTSPVSRLPFLDGCTSSTFSTLYTGALRTLCFISPQSTTMFPTVTKPGTRKVLVGNYLG